MNTFIHNDLHSVSYGYTKYVNILCSSILEVIKIYILIVLNSNVNWRTHICILFKIVYSSSVTM